MHSVCWLPLTEGSQGILERFQKDVHADLGLLDLAYSSYASPFVLFHACCLLTPLTEDLWPLINEGHATLPFVNPGFSVVATRMF